MKIISQPAQRLLCGFCGKAAEAPVDFPDNVVLYPSLGLVRHAAEYAIAISSLAELFGIQFPHRRDVNH